MRFFKIVFFTLFFVGLFNLIHASVDYNLRDQVYQCSEVSTSDPIEVQKKCKKWIATKKITDAS